ncbi:unnamed protein product [Laminaria digitata]
MFVYCTWYVLSLFRFFLFLVRSSEWNERHPSCSLRSLSASLWRYWGLRPILGRSLPLWWGKMRWNRFCARRRGGCLLSWVLISNVLSIVLSTVLSAALSAVFSAVFRTVISTVLSIVLSAVLSAVLRIIFVLVETCSRTKIYRSDRQEHLSQGLCTTWYEVASLRPSSNGRHRCIFLHAASGKPTKK